MLSRRGLEFPYRALGGMFRVPLKLSVFSASYSSLGETRLCSRECSIKKQRFYVILRHFLEHFRLFFAGFRRFVAVIAVFLRQICSCVAYCYRLCMEKPNRIDD